MLTVSILVFDIPFITFPFLSVFKFSSGFVESSHVANSYWLLPAINLPSICLNFLNSSSFQLSNLIESHSNPEHNITNIILVDASESLNGSRVEAYAKGDIRLYVICLIFAKRFIESYKNTVTITLSSLLIRTRNFCCL